MDMYNFSKIACVAVLLAVAGCASHPTQINNVCAVFDQRDGFFNSWRSSAEESASRYGVPVHVLMATVRKESGFKSDARPPRTKLLGFIPWTRQSSAYGYSQALDGTWTTYKAETGNFAARRSNFDDAVDFIGWYHSRSASALGIDPGDTYRLYLAYYLGWTGYKRGNWDPGVDKVARDTDLMARNYAQQLNSCR
ncbi:MAG: hypothetical protein M9924_13220 [Rhizobiaceae bacterium]|nr:hypothetical protein [Rhizobiaceae bacterium]